MFLWLDRATFKVGMRARAREREREREREPLTVLLSERLAGKSYTKAMTAFFHQLFHTALRSEKSQGLLGTRMGAQDGHLDFHTVPELC